MEHPKLEEYRRMFNVELPKSDSMDEYIDFILSKIGPMSDSLADEGMWLNQRWTEIQDKLDFQENVLHIFRDGGEYMIVVDGNISTGGWQSMDSPRTIILQHSGRHELYDLAFLDDTFFILKKHGDQSRRGKPKYFVLGREGSVRGLEWRDCMELMFNVYRGNSRWTTYLTIVLVILAVIVVLSIL